MEVVVSVGAVAPADPFGFDWSGWTLVLTTGGSASAPPPSISDRATVAASEMSLRFMSVLLVIEEGLPFPEGSQAGVHNAVRAGVDA